LKLAGTYVYCISDLSTGRELGNIGLFDGPVRYVGHKGIGAFVSTLQSERINPELEMIMAHQRVVEESRKLSTTLPVKFGVIFNSDKGIKELLAKDFEKYSSKLAAFRDKDEFGVKVIQTSKQEVPRARIASKTKTVRAAGAGTEYLTRLREEEAARTERLQNKEKAAEMIRKQLSEFAEKDALLRTDLPQILINGAFLVKRSNQEAFTSQIETIRKQIGDDGLLIHVSGPWAPYSFC
jgi:gas vesicle protein GvpL/GvpF